MLNRISRATKNRKGFTLVELMVVMAIIGVLIAIALPVYNSATDGANKRVVEANLRTIDSAITQYKAANNTNTDPTQAQLSPGYLNSWPNTPAGATYDIAGGRGVVDIAENTFGTHAAAADANLDALQALANW
ncbi:MAG: type II secretion system protein [Bacillota bacterium]